jgi:hypothetical protein
VKSVERDAPEERPDDEDPAVGREDASELVARLVGGDDTIGGQGHRADGDERQAPVVLDPEPHEG